MDSSFPLPIPSVKRDHLPRILICSLLILFFFTGTVCADQTDREQERKAQKKAIAVDIQKHRINISKMQEGIQKQLEQVERSEQKEQSILSELEEVDARYEKQLAKIQALQEQVAAQQELIRTKEIEMQAATKAKEKVQKHLQKRIKSFYKMGEIGITTIAFSAETLPTLLKFRDSFSTLLDYDKRLIDIYHNSIIELQKTRDALTLEKGVLDDFIRQEIVEQKKIELIRQEKEKLLTRIKTQKNLYERAVIEMGKAADQLAASLEGLKIRDKLLDQGFLLDKGTLPSPLPFKIVGLYGQKRKNKLGIESKSTGITFEAPGTNPVKAVYEGTVTYASYLRGYGKTVIIDHGHQYHTITSRVEKLLVKKGAKVKQGDVIALTGDTATVMDDGIYFEIRHGSATEDPLLWLDKKGLILP